MAWLISLIDKTKTLTNLSALRINNTEMEADRLEYSQLTQTTPIIEPLFYQPCHNTFLIPQPTMDQHPAFLAAVEEAKKGFAEGGVPIGACLVSKDGKILGRGHNMQVQTGDATTHVSPNFNISRCFLRVLPVLYECSQHAHLYLIGGDGRSRQLRTSPYRRL